jgi:DNA polymerase-3 subunit beta
MTTTDTTAANATTATSYACAIDLRALHAVACATSSDETRYYLIGVLLEYTATHVRMTATDGHMLITLRQPYVDGMPRPDADALPAPVIVPADLIKRLKLARIEALNLATLAVNGLQLTFDCHGATHGGMAIDGSFPDYRRILPAKVSGEIATYDVLLLARFAQARSLLQGNVKRKRGEGSTAGHTVIAHNGYGPGVVDLAHGTGYEAVGVVMPIRADAGARNQALDHITDWATK